MLNETLHSLFIFSLAGTLLAAALLLIRPITRKFFGYGWHYYVWLGVLAVMMLPVRIRIPAPAPDPVAPAVHTVAAPTPAAEPTAGGTTLPAVETAEFDPPDWLGAVWLTGAEVMLLLYLGGYAHLKLRLRKEAAPSDCADAKGLKVLVWKGAASPFVLGVLRPVLVLPERELTREQLNNIMLHERTHVRRGDVLVKWFAALTKCVHWFNPAVYLIVRQLNAECEISCDLSVVRGMDKERETSYIDTILALLSVENARAVPLITGMTGSKKDIKRRFTMIKNKKFTGRAAAAVSVFVMAVMLSATVLASGVAAGMTEDGYTVDIWADGEKIEFTNKPIVKNGQVYVPLREALEKAGSDIKSRITWTPGEITVAVANGGSAGLYGLKIGESEMSLRHIEPYELETAAFDDVHFIRIIGVIDQSAPFLKGSVTYASITDINYMLYGFLNIRDENGRLKELEYRIYDRNGSEISLPAKPAAIPDAELAKIVQECMAEREKEYSVPGYTWSVVSDSTHPTTGAMRYYIEITPLSPYESRDYLSLDLECTDGTWKVANYTIEK